jgi:DNA-directed RNA polymerase specialized sigma subunit
VRQAAEDRETATRELRNELGREPTDDELGERLAKLHGWESSPLMPRADPD